MTRDKYEYTIGGHRFHQQKLVLGQVEHLGRVLKGLSFEVDPLDVGAILTTVGGKLPEAMAAVLLREDEEPSALLQDLDGPRERVAFLRVHLEWDVAVQVVRDFFGCNPIGTLPSLLSGLNEWLATSTGALTSRNSMPSSPAGSTANVPVSGHG